MRKICANCGLYCEKEYYKALDNYLQVNYFDDEDCNCFCSQECFCEYVMLESFDIDEEATDNDNE